MELSQTKALRKTFLLSVSIAEHQWGSCWQGQWADHSVLGWNLSHIHWHLSLLWLAGSWHGMQVWPSGGYCRSMPLVTGMLHLSKISAPTQRVALVGTLFCLPDLGWMAANNCLDLKRAEVWFGYLGVGRSWRAWTLVGLGFIPQEVNTAQ